MDVTKRLFTVAVTVSALVIYVGSAIVFGILEPESLARGLIIKIIIIVALAKAIQTAAAYQRERDAEAQASWDELKPEYE